MSPQKEQQEKEQPLQKTNISDSKGKGKLKAPLVPASAPADDLLGFPDEDEEDEFVLPDEEDEAGEEFDTDFASSEEEEEEFEDYAEEDDVDTLEDQGSSHSLPPAVHSVDHEVAELLDEAQEFGDGGDMVLGLRSGRARIDFGNLVQDGRGETAGGSSSSGHNKRKSEAAHSSSSRSKS